MLDAFDVLLYSIVVTVLMRDFGLTKQTAGLLNTLTLIASAIGSLTFGVLADRYGRRRMLSLSILFYSVFTFACGLATSIAALAICRFLLGLGMGGEWNTGAALVAETWPDRWRGRALGIVQSAWAIGYALAALVANALLPIGGWRSVFFVGVLPALAVIWIQRHVPEPELWRESRRQTSPRPAWGPFLPRMLLLLVMNAFGMFAWWGLFTWIPGYLMLPAAAGGRNLTQLGLTQFLLVLNLCGMFPGYLLFGVLADRFGRKKTLVTYLVLAAVMAFVFSAVRSPAAMLASATIAAFFGTGFFTGSGILGSELFPTSMRASALGISYNGARGLSSLAPFIIGSIGQSRGLPWAFGGCGLAFACAALTALFLPETRNTGIDKQEPRDSRDITLAIWHPHEDAKSSPAQSSL